MDENEELFGRRRSPLARHAPLWVAFLVLSVVGVVTVLVPEITDDGDEEDESSETLDEETPAAEATAP